MALGGTQWVLLDGFNLAGLASLCLSQLAVSPACLTGRRAVLADPPQGWAGTARAGAVSVLQSSSSAFHWASPLLLRLSHGHDGDAD